MWEFGWNLAGFTLCARLLGSPQVAITNYLNVQGDYYAIEEIPMGSGMWTAGGLFIWGHANGNFPYGQAVEAD